MKERIKELRKALGLTQQKFGERIGIKQNSVAQIEIGRNTSDQTILAICREYNVNETWLRTGEGEMFVQRTRSQEIVDFMGELVQTDNEFKRRFVAALARLDEKDWALIEKMADKLRGDE
ncbi:MAG: helix-turn-helix transcriptional regulator [Clostridium sp.]|nr:helix-turn-helix transcriptional regulator [Clostridium sp.]